MHSRSLSPLFLAALSLSVFTSCHISDRGMDFSPLTDRFEPAVDDEVLPEGDTISISTPIATPAGVALNNAPAPVLAPTPTAPPPQPAASPAPAAGGAAYVVKSGDTLSGIARRSNTTVPQLCTANGITAAAPLKIGQKLVLPAAGAAAPLAKAPAAKPTARPAAQPGGKARTHTVQSGETLYAIARKHGVSPAALMQANKLTPATAGKLRIGSTLTIPAK